MLLYSSDTITQARQRLAKVKSDSEGESTDYEKGRKRGPPKRLIDHKRARNATVSVAQAPTTSEMSWCLVRSYNTFQYVVYYRNLPWERVKTRNVGSFIYLGYITISGINPFATAVNLATLSEVTMKCSAHILLMCQCHKRDLHASIHHDFL